MPSSISRFLVICDIKLEVVCNRYVLDINGTLFFIFLFKLRT